MTDPQRATPSDARWYPPTGYLPEPAQLDFLPADLPAGQHARADGQPTLLHAPTTPARPRRHRAGLVAVALLVVAGLTVGGVTAGRSLIGATPSPSPTGSAGPATGGPTTPAPTTARPTTPAPTSPAPTSSAPTTTSGPKTGPMPAPQDAADADRIVKKSSLYRAKPAARMSCADADPSSMSVKQMRAWANATLSKCLMPYWSTAFLKATGYTLPTPKVVLLDTTKVKTPCGSTTVTSNEAFFCSTNDTIYLWSRNIRNQPAEIAVSHFVFAHEFGHHLQWAAGILESSEALAQLDPERDKELSRRVELQASCLGGRFLGAIGPGLSRFESAGFPDTIRTGDRPGGPRTHGSYASNQRWIGAGYRSTAVSKCNTFTAPTIQIR